MGFENLVEVSCVVLLEVTLCLVDDDLVVLPLGISDELAVAFLVIWKVM